MEENQQSSSSIYFSKGISYLILALKAVNIKEGIALFEGVL